MFPLNLRSAECYVQEEGDTIRIGNSLIERIISREGGRLRTVGIVNKRTGRTWKIDTLAEARLNLATASPRIEIPEWRYMPGTRKQVSPSQDEGFQKGYHRPEVDDRAWQLVECLNSPGEGTDPVLPGYGWFRTTFRLSADVRGQPVAFNLGGYDNEDWQFYRVFVNGQEVGNRELSARWRDPTPFVLQPENPSYPVLRFGSENVLAVQAGRMNKSLPNMDRGEALRYYFRSRLVDQFITVGTAATEVSDFRLKDYWPDNLGLRRPIVLEEQSYRPKDWAVGGDRDWMWCTFWTENKAEKIGVIYHYQVRSGDPIVRKKLEIRNHGDSPRLLLDVNVEDFRLDGALTDGGQGFPILVDDEAYCALEHPAGVNQGLSNAIRLRHFPGVEIARRQGVFSQEAIFGVTERGKAREGFQEYLGKKGRRQNKWVSVYDPAGLGGGYINPHDPLYDITEQIVMASIDVLETLRTRGITFDYYIIDVGWQDHSSDLTWFKSDNFPNGPRKIVERLDEVGVKFGLWFSTTYAPWSCGDYPPVQHCIGGTGLGYSGEDNICMAAEPYPSIFRNAILYHIRENKLRALKLDMGRYYCNSTEHGHLPGKYSVEAQMNSTVETARSAIRACPNLFIMWYWGHNSPFWLLYGDTVQDKGLHGEAAEVASWPNPIYRSSVSLNVEQAARYAEFLPPLGQDSLGTWIGDMICWNRIGKDHWQDAWLLDLARGSLLNQTWGNLAMFDDSDVSFLAEWYDFMRDNWRLYLHTQPILGDPWKAQVYGYASGNGVHSVTTVNNPGFKAAQVRLRLDEQIGLQRTNSGFLVRQRYRRRGILSPSEGTRFAYGDVIELLLRPFEVVVLEMGKELDTFGWPAWTAPNVVDASRIVLEGRNVSPNDIAISITIPPSASSLVEGYAPRAMVGEIQLPTIDTPLTLALITRQTEGDMHWLHRENHTLIKLRAKVGDQELEYQTVPRNWLQQGRGCPWLLFRLSVNPTHSEQILQFELAGLLPAEVNWQVEAWVYHEWWHIEP